MKQRWILKFSILILYALSAQAVEKYDIRGYVRDKDSGETLPYANISVEGSNRGSITNNDGYFVLVNEPAGMCTLKVKYIGYKEEVIIVNNLKHNKDYLSINLVSNIINLEGVTVTASTQILEMAEKEVSQITLSPRQLMQLPNIGEVDIFRSLQMLPGISAASDGESGLYVRGGKPDQNLILFDGMTIYHVDHFFGFFSAFNADAIKDVQLYKGGFPAEYGGRLSSIVKLTGKSGNRSEPQLGVGINLLSAHGQYERPLGDKATFLFAFRRSYTDLIQSPLYTSIYELMTGDETSAMPGGGVKSGGMKSGGGMMSAEFQPSFYFYDLNSKLTWTPGKKDIFSISFYSGKDDLDKSQDFSSMKFNYNETGDEVSMQTSDYNRWGNLGFSGKWSRQWNDRIQSDFLVAKSNYFSEYERERNLNTSFSIPGDTSDTKRGFSSSSSEDNTVNDISSRFDLTWHAHENHIVKSGIWLSQFESQFNFTLNDSITMLERNSAANLAAFYLQDKWKLGLSEITAGVRANYFSGTN
ncbi:MAG: TonB-dependent receptor, partial [Candidatus Marinimicrobia bacterium]|nr:TonB-dependent receptor [Candidatus Neomarinimicrobiota bacterium]